MEKEKLINMTKENVETLLDKKFIKVYDLMYAPGKHYYDATRRDLSNLVALKSEEEFKNMLPDAVTCAVIVKLPNDEPKLLLSYEYRYTTKNFLLSPPAGLIDPEDADSKEPLLRTAKREIYEETGIKVGENPEDRIFLMNRLLFSSPGMTDESNGFVCAVVNLDDLSSLNQEGAVGSECFDGFTLLTKAEAQEILKKGTDANDNYFSLATYTILLYFCTDMWQ